MKQNLIEKMKYQKIIKSVTTFKFFLPKIPPSGFTLIELLIVVAIITVMTILVMPLYGQFQNSQSLVEATSNLQSILRQTQNKALSGTNCTNGDKSSSWQITLNKLSAEQTSSNSESYYSISGSGCVNSQGTPVPTPAPEIIYLPQNVIIDSVTLSDPNNISPCDKTYTTGPISVSFANISGELSFDDGTGTCGDITKADIKLQTIESSSQINLTDVVVEQGGSIYVNSQTPTPTPTPAT